MIRLVAVQVLVSAVFACCLMACTSDLTTECAVDPDCAATGACAAALCCAGKCVNARSDTQNCGGCGRVCMPLLNASPACTTGFCGLGLCRNGFGNCDDNAATGCETNLLDDAKNCGSCGSTCTPGPHQTATCGQGICTFECAKGYAHCSADQTVGCEAVTDRDIRNCGGCGNACGPLDNATAACTGGTCTIASCHAGRADCDGMMANGCEVDTGGDPAHCGGCGKLCPEPPHAAVRCTGGECGLGTCAVGFANCNNSPADGCEVNTGSDARNCGACGKVCSGANSVQACRNAACAVSSCNAGFADCDGRGDNGCEVALQGSVANCGMCGNACPDPPNAKAGCAGGQCTLAQCSPGFADCDKAMNNGCEVSVQTDLLNCGACGVVCSAPNATPACVAGKCAIMSCNGGFTDCDKQVQNGCEANLVSDVNNCGACGNACVVAHGKATCSNKVCGVVSCDPDFADCDNQPGNGCEASLKSDPANCSVCGKACPMNMPKCDMGDCVADPFPGSVLITPKQGAQINTWIGVPGQSWKVCLRMTRDGATPATFHARCDGLGPTVVIVSTDTGVLIGGYGSGTWSSKVDEWSGDCTSFLFSLTNNFKHTATCNGAYMRSHPQQGPVFGSGIDLFTDVGHGFCSPGFTYACRVGTQNTPMCINDLCGAQVWNTKEMEIWYK